MKHIIALILGTQLVLTNIPNGLENSAEFSCSDTVHGYVTLPAKAVGEHVIEGIWMMPNGVEKEHSKNRLNFPPPGRRTAYIWLKFDNKSDGLMGSMRSAEESDGNKVFNGEWRVRVLWDGKPLIESKFKVNCS